MKRHFAYLVVTIVLAALAMMAQLSIVSPAANAGQGRTTPECEGCKAACQAQLSECDQRARNDNDRRTTRGQCVKAFEACVRACPCPPGHNNPHPPSAR